MEYLLFRLYGPLVSWGSIAVGQERPSDAHPSKSALLGLLAAAMGVKRDQETTHQQMAAAYCFAIRVDSAGVMLSDYHTAQVPPERRKTVYYTRRDELNADTINTILSSREYRCDALYTIACWVQDNHEPPFPLNDLAAGLHKPRFTLYLGRKSCPLALPVQASVIAAANLETVFAQANFKDAADFIDQPKDLLSRADQILLYWDADDTTLDTGDWQALQTITRHDQPLSRRRWQFAPRQEHQAMVKQQPED